MVVLRLLLGFCVESTAKEILHQFRVGGEILFDNMMPDLSWCC